MAKKADFPKSLKSHGLCRMRVHDLRHSCVHFSNPFKLIFRFQLFRHTLPFGIFLYQPRKQFFCLFVNICKITVQFAACEQRCVSRSFMFLQIVFVLLSPYADWLIFLFGWKGKSGDKIIPLMYISATHFFKKF